MKEVNIDPISRDENGQISGGFSPLGIVDDLTSLWNNNCTSSDGLIFNDNCGCGGNACANLPIKNQGSNSND